MRRASTPSRSDEWHPPYFDPTALADDLEKVAQPMLEWLDRVFPLAKEPELFAQALQQIDENIGGYPEWMQGGDEFCGLGPQATACVLRWTWRACEGHAAQRPGVPRSGFYGLEQECVRVGLDEDQCFKFFVALPEESRREIHAGLERRRNTPRLSGGHTLGVAPDSSSPRTGRLIPRRTWQSSEAALAQKIGTTVRRSLPPPWRTRTMRTPSTGCSARLPAFCAGTDDEVWLPEDSLLPAAGHHYYGLAHPRRRAEVAGTVGDYRAEGQSAGTSGRLPIAARRFYFVRGLVGSLARLRRVPAAGRRCAKSRRSSLPNGGTGRLPNVPLSLTQQQRPEDSWVRWLD